MDFQIIRSARRTLVAEIKNDGSVLVRAPFFYPSHLIDRFVRENEVKIAKKQVLLRSRPKPPMISKRKVEEMREFAKKNILPRVYLISKQTGLSFGDVRITSARTRFGSCSAKNSICLSLYLALADEKEIDYVILHELCHTKEHNHSRRFYQLVESFMPDWKEREKSLKKIVIPEVVE